MKKIFIILSLWMICTLTACGIENENKESTQASIKEQTVQDSSDSKKKENTQNGSTDEVDVPAAYSTILNMYVSALNEKWDGDTLMKNGLNLLSLDLYGNNSLNLIGYNMIDFDGNGVKELVIGTTEQVTDEFYQKIVFDVYTLEQDGTSIQVLSSSARNRYFYVGGKLFADLGSSGANDNTNATLEYDGKGLTDINTIKEPSDYVQIDLTPMNKWTYNGNKQTNASSNTDTETQKISSDLKANAKGELTSLLDKINSDVVTGTTGCKMTSVRITSDLLNWGVGTELTNEEIRATVLDWLVNKGNDEAVVFSEKMSLVDETYHELLGKDAKDLLDSAGCENAAYPWSEEPIEGIETIMKAVGLRD